MIAWVLFFVGIFVMVVFSIAFLCCEMVGSAILCVVVGLAVMIWGIVLLSIDEKKECESSGGVYHSEVVGWVSNGKGGLTPIVSSECVKN